MAGAKFSLVKVGLIYVGFEPFRVCSDANATAGVVLGLGVDGISKHPNTVITQFWTSQIVF